MTEHKNIYAAIAAATGEVKRLAKDSRNVEQKYNFASVDDFLEMTGPICAKHGLVVLMDEEEVTDFERQGKYGVTFWLRIRFAIQVCHTSGESLPVARRTVEVIRTGAQSFGSAQSYALKQFLRALLQISTGDQDDADFAEKGDGKPVQPVPAPRRDNTEAVAHAVAALQAAESLDQLAAIWTDLPKDVKANVAVAGAKDRRKADLQQPAPADDLAGDRVPF